MKTSTTLLLVAGAAVAAVGTFFFVQKKKECDFCVEEVDRGDLIHALQLTPEVCGACAEHLKQNHTQALQIAVQRGDERNVLAFAQNYEAITGESYPGPLLTVPPLSGKLV